MPSLPVTVPSSPTLPQASERRSLKHKTKEIRQELQLANKALTEVRTATDPIGGQCHVPVHTTQVRRAQLQKLLGEEHRQFEEELHSMGLAFHTNRL